MSLKVGQPDTIYLLPKEKHGFTYKTFLPQKINLNLIKILGLPVYKKHKGKNHMLKDTKKI